MKPDVRLVIVTGMSGAGKTQTLKCLEDLGFFCVDNLPPALIVRMAEMCEQSEGRISKLALGIDIRSGDFFTSAVTALEDLDRQGFLYQIVFLEASDPVLVRRYKETRHRHPLAQQGRIQEGIRQERALLDELRGRAQHIIDTSALSVQQLRHEVTEIFREGGGRPPLQVHVVSFGFKHGTPLDLDLLFDVRFLPNPHYVSSLRQLTGEDGPVEEYVNRWPLTQEFFGHLKSLVGFLLPHYQTEGKTQLTIGIGCTGGQHRSVALARRLGDFVRQEGYNVQVEHRDISRAPKKDAPADPAQRGEAE